MTSLEMVRARFARNEGLPFADILTEASVCPETFTIRRAMGFRGQNFVEDRKRRAFMSRLRACWRAFLDRFRTWARTFRARLREVPGFSAPVQRFTLPFVW